MKNFFYGFSVDKVEQPLIKKKKPFSANIKIIDEKFLSQPRYIPVLQRIIQYIKKEKLSEQDLQSEDEICKLLKYAFESDRKPGDDHVESVKALFKDTTVQDFKKHLYRYSEIISMYLWVDRVQKEVTDPQEKNRILGGEPVNSNGYKLYCVLTDTEYVEKEKSTLSKDQNVNLFKNVLKTSKSKVLKSFIKAHFRNDFSDQEKLEITHCTRKFL